MTNNDCLHVACKMSSLGGNLARYAVMRGVRKQVEVLGPDKLHKALNRVWPFDLNKQNRFLNTYSKKVPSFYDPNSRTIFTSPADKRHELTHAYQALMPVTKAPLSGLPRRLPVVGEHIGSVFDELGARLADRAFQTSRTPTWSAIKDWLSTAPLYAQNFAGTPSHKAWRALDFARWLILGGKRN